MRDEDLVGPGFVWGVRVLVLLMRSHVSEGVVDVVVECNSFLVSFIKVVFEGSVAFPACHCAADVIVVELGIIPE